MSTPPPARSVVVAIPDPDCEMCEGAPPVVINGVVQYCEGCCEPDRRADEAEWADRESRGVPWYIDDTGSP